jgi:hypothetical protein
MFGTFFMIFHSVGNVIIPIPTDELMLFRGVVLQPTIEIHGGSSHQYTIDHQNITIYHHLSPYINHIYTMNTPLITINVGFTQCNEPTMTGDGWNPTRKKW